MPAVSVIIPAFNVADTLDAQLAALTRQSYDGDWEVLVADNGSTDATAAVARAWCDRLPIRVVDASARRGCGAAKNQAVEQAHGELLLFCDGDDIVGEHFVSAHVASLADAEVSSGAVLRFADERELAQRRPETPSKAPTLLGFLPYAQGANTGVRRRALEAAGGFNEANPFAEDVELSWEVQVAGGRLRYTPEALVNKRDRPSSGQTLRQYYRYGTCDVDLYQRFRHAGAQRPSGGQLLRVYVRLLVGVPSLLLPRFRERWLRQAGRRAGRLRASAGAHCWFV